MITQPCNVIDGICVFHDDIDTDHEDYPAEGLDVLFQHEEEHFWFVSRREFILKYLRKYIGYESKLIEIGAGTANVAHYLMQNGYKNISVGEMHRNGLKYAEKYGFVSRYQFDLMRAPFEAEFDAVGFFDVLEHIEDDEGAIRQIHKLLQPEGYLVLTVPAHQWLWSRFDVLSGHKRRYTKQALRTLLERNGFEVMEARYFMMAIVPLLLLRKMVFAEKNETRAEAALSIHPFINRILLMLTRLENSVNAWLPNVCGGSLMMIARRR